MTCEQCSKWYDKKSCETCYEFSNFAPYRAGNQTRLQSLIEQFFNVGSGFIVSLVFWTWVVAPVWNLPVKTSENLEITAAFTVLSVIRGYIWRRLFNARIKR